MLIKMIAAIETLDETVMKEFGSRKKPGRLSLVVDVETSDIYAVPKDTEHIDFIKQFETDPSYLVPVHLDFSGGEVSGVIVGESGIEHGLGVRHSHADLNVANSDAYGLISKSGVQIAEDHKNKVHYA
jgi:hypothetical protein